MAIDAVSIGNMALAHVGAKGRIESLDEQTPGAKQVKLWYDVARTLTLENHDWGFARVRLTLALHSEAPPEEWDFRYQFPANVVSLRGFWNPIGPSADAIPYELELASDQSTVTILTNAEDAVAFFTANVASVVLFPLSFVSAFSRKLAEMIAYSLTGKTEVQDQQTERFEMEVSKAATFDAMQGMKPPPRESEWIRGRR